MELKLTHESICINEVVFDEMIEQSVELDCLCLLYTSYRP